MLSGTMSRAAKGRVAPPPRLGAGAQQVAETVGALLGVSVQAHWAIGSQTQVNGTDFYVGEEELGHIHLDGEAHVPLGTKLARLVIDAGLARPFPWAREFVAIDAAFHDDAVWLFELRHAQISGAAHAELTARVAARR